MSVVVAHHGRPPERVRERQIHVQELPQIQIVRESDAGVPVGDAVDGVEGATHYEHLAHLVMIEGDVEYVLRLHRAGVHLQREMSTTGQEGSFVSFSCSLPSSRRCCSCRRCRR